MSTPQLINRKILHFAYILISSFWGGCSNTDTSAETPLYEAVKTSIQPRIDGEIDSVWNGVKSEPIKHMMEEIDFLKVTDSVDLSIHFKMTWDETNAYLLFDVTDKDKFLPVWEELPPWEGDNIELWFNIKNQLKYELEYGKDSVIAWTPLTGIEFAQANREGGYIMEMKIPFKTLEATPHENFIFGCKILAFDNDQDYKLGYFSRPIGSVMTWAKKENEALPGNIKLVNK